jgi:hypothetical protein
MERFSETLFPPAGKTPQEAFTDYLKTGDGILSFGNATAVQLYSMYVGAQDDAKP